MGTLGEYEGAATQEGDDGVECGCPVLFGCLRVVTERFDVEADSETFLRAGEIDECGTDDAVDHGVGMIERCGESRETVKELLLLVE